MERMNVGIIGAGAISGIYLQNMINRCPSLKVVFIAAAHLSSAQKKAEEFHLKACTVEEMLTDPKIDLVVVLTPVGTHEALIRKALNAGKHVYTEKTITDGPDSARMLARLAKEKNLYLGCAPDTFLGAALQTARKAVDDGMLGEIHSFSISATRCNDVLLSMFSFLREPGCGILYDYAVYYITALVSLLGPVGKVAAVVSNPYPVHTGILKDRAEYGKNFDSPGESQVSAILQLESGVTGTIHIDAETVNADEAYFTIYGKKGMLKLTDPNQFGGDVQFFPTETDGWKPLKGRTLEPVNDLTENWRGIGPQEMAEAIFKKRENRANSTMACHVLDVLAGILESGKNGTFMDILSTCTRPEPFRPEK